RGTAERRHQIEITGWCKGAIPPERGIRPCWCNFPLNALALPTLGRRSRQCGYSWTYGQLVHFVCAASIREEMESCLRQREHAYRHADRLLDEFDELALSDKALRRALAQIELRLQRSGTSSRKRRPRSSLPRSPTSAPISSGFAPT